MAAVEIAERPQPQTRARPMLAIDLAAIRKGVTALIAAIPHSMLARCEPEVDAALDALRDVETAAQRVNLADVLSREDHVAAAVEPWQIRFGVSRRSLSDARRRTRDCRSGPRPLR